MTAIDTTTHAESHAARTSPRWVLSDIITVAQRDLIALIRIPTAVVFAIIQPIMFVLLFRYVFGGAIPIKGTQYVNFLIPGILVQTTLFGAVGTAIGLAEDLQKGLVERFRALPMTRLAVLGGRTVADLCRNVLVLLVITGMGFLVGFRPQGGFVAYVLASLLMLAFAYGLSWGFAYIGLAAPNSETAQAMAFPLIFPLSFASSVFVPLYKMPGWLQVFARNQPVSQVTNAVRALMMGSHDASVMRAPIGNSVWVSLLWIAGVFIFLVPLSTARFRRAT